MLSKPDFEAKIEAIGEDAAAAKTGVEALIANEAIPDFVGTALDTVHGQVTELKDLVTPPAPPEPTEPVQPVQ